MILSFKKQFEDKIWNGSKKHSIRKDSYNRWKAGRKIHFSTGVRTPDQNCFKEGVCISTQRIRIVHKGNRVWIYIEDKLYSNLTGIINKIAKNDGFDTTEDFIKWFDKDFTGIIIHWTELRY